jgi:hypothetical protein
MPRDHVIDPSIIHHRWDADLEPIRQATPCKSTSWKLQHGDWGWAAFLPDLGLLPEDFPHGYVRTFALKDGTAEFAPYILCSIIGASRWSTLVSGQFQ